MADQRTLAETVRPQCSGPADSAPPVPASPAAQARRRAALIRCFTPDAGPAIRALMREDERFAELAIVFPGLLYALATGHGTLEARAAARRAIVTGAPLKDAAAALGLPMWLRRLSPRAFQGPLDAIPASETFARRIANRMPRAGDDTAFWLAAVTFAARTCGDDFAVWLAQQPIHGEPGGVADLLTPLAAYAWFSRSRSTAAQRLIVVRWRSELAIDTAICAAKSWLNRMRLVAQLRPGVVTDPWLAGGSSGEFEITPLVDAPSLLAESHAMHNCADQYGDRIARDRCRLFGIAGPHGRVATMEIAAHPREIGILTIAQLKGRHNMPAPTEVWQAAHRWISTQQGLRRPATLLPPERPLCARTWGGLMAPYHAAVGAVGPTSAAGAASMVARYEAGLARLAARAGVTSWLFT